MSPFYSPLWVAQFGGGNLGSRCVMETCHGSGYPPETSVLPEQSQGWFQLLTGLHLMPFEIPQLCSG